MSNQLEIPQSHYKIEVEEGKKNAILTILSDRYCRAIIEAITYTPKSVIELTAETRIPLSTVYRRIQMLQDSKLLLTSGIVSEDGKRIFLYKSKISGIQSNYENGLTKVRLLFNRQQHT